MRRLVLAITAVVTSWGAALAAQPVTTYTLDNGLQVVLAPDRNVPKVVLSVSYRVGSMNEPAGRSGFAHLFEHLMFSGTEAYPDFDYTLSSLGVNNNASTWEDKTIYYSEAMSSTLPTLMAVEADRMANLGRAVDQAELDLQRSVVKNEMRQNVIDEAGVAGWEALWSALFPKSHPYSRTVLGSLADLDAATLDDVHGFFNTYYVPNNAIMVLVGDFEITDARELVDKTFGLVPRGADVPRPTAPLPDPTRVRLDMEDRVPSPVVALGFTGPAYESSRNGALLIAAEILGNDEYGLLRNWMVNGKSIATYTDAYWYPGFLAGRFWIEAAAVDGVTAQDIEAELRAAVTDFLASPIDPRDIDRARRTILIADRIEREPLVERGEAIAEAADMLGKPDLALQDDPSIVNATPEEIATAVREILRLEDASVLTIKPGKRGGYPAIFTEASGTPQPFTALDRPVVAIPNLETRTPTPPILPAMETAILSNGVRIIHYTTPNAPLAYLAAKADGGWPNAPQGKEGLLDMAASMAFRGAADRDFGAFAKAAKDIGANIGSKSEYLGTMMTLSVPPDTFDAGVGLLADAVLRPSFDAGEWDVLVTETVDNLTRREAELPGVASRAGKDILFPPAEGKPAIDWSIAAVQAMTLDDVKAAYARLFKPASTTFYSVGPVPLKTVVASLEKAFGTWKDATPGYEPQQHSAPKFPDRMTVLLLPEPGASQSALFIARPAPGIGQEGRSESVAVMRLLGDDFTSRLNSVIREEKGYTYGTFGQLLDFLHDGSAMIIEATVERDNTGAALVEVFKGFESLVKVPVTQHELDRTITAFQTTIAATTETSGGLFDSLIVKAANGETLEADGQAKQNVTKLQLAAVQKQGATLASLDNALIIVAGDPDIVMPQLVKIGLTDVKLIERVSEQSGEDPAQADRSADMENPLNSEPPSGRALGGGTTRAVHGCAGTGDTSSGCDTDQDGAY